MGLASGSCVLPATYSPARFSLASHHERPAREHSYVKNILSIAKSYRTPSSAILSSRHKCAHFCKTRDGSELALTGVTKRFCQGGQVR